MDKIFVDTNIWLRFFLEDHKPHNKKSREIVVNIEKGKYKGVTTSLVIAEVVWTLLSFYKSTKEEVVDCIESILSLPNLQIENRSKLEKAIKLFSIVNVDFIDCYNYVAVIEENIKKVATFDDDWKKFEEIKII